MSQAFRLRSGGRIDRSQSLAFTFDGRRYTGFAGDTLASALLANGVRVTGRSFKYHRPRGVYAAGFDEPNTLVQLGQGASAEPNLKATQVELSDGLVARAVNASPSARWDWMALTQWFKPFMPAGFYYKTFMAPSWRLYEPAIRAAAGLGRSPVAADPDRYDKRNVDCDVLVIGAGASGLEAASAAASRGERVLLVDAKGDVEAPAGVQVLSRTTVFGYYDHNQLAAVEQVREGAVRQRLWRIRAGEVILATGAIERPLVFPNNDRPGVMLAGAAQTYLRDYAVLPGRRVVIATNNDSAYTVAHELRDAGVEIVAIADVRKGLAPTDVRGARGVTAVELHDIDVAGRALAGSRQLLQADALLVSGGWNPTVHLFSQSGGKLRYDTPTGTFMPSGSVQRERSIGMAAGAGIADYGTQPIWEIDVAALGRNSGKSWVDFLSDVTAADLKLALRENYRSVEHVKRYTTAGMAPDQGKTSNVNAIGILANALGAEPGAIGTTKFRPPFDPVTFGAIAGRRKGAFYRPLKRLAAHDQHLEAGAHFEDYGWQRPSTLRPARANPRRSRAK
jgi:sarcosine oxidase subunit alpha